MQPRVLSERLHWWRVRLRTFKRIWITLIALILILLGGTFGYVIIEEDWSPTEAFYMTIITLSTVGFQEVRVLSDDGRLFTSGLILLGIGVVGYGFGSVAAFFIEGELRDLFRIRRMEKTIERMQDHIIICGYGDEGKHAGEELKRSNTPFLVIDKNPDVVQRLQDNGVPAINGDATEDDIILQAGVSVAQGLIAAVQEDSENVFVTLTARGFNPDLTIVARAAHEGTVSKLFRAGASKVISSAEIGGRRMASVLLRPRVVNFLDVMMHDDELALRLEEVRVSAEGPFAGKSIRELHVRARTGTLIIAHQQSDDAMEINPGAETILSAGDVLIVLGNEKQIEELLRIANAD